MNFETRDGKEWLPDEEDIYGVNDAEERDAFNALLGLRTTEDDVRRRALLMRLIATGIVAAVTFSIAAFAILRVLGH